VKRNDIIIFVVVILIGLGVWLGLQSQQKVADEVVQVYIDGILTESLPLDKEGIYRYEHAYGINTFEIRAGKVKMVQATCPDLVCVHQSAIYKEHTSLVCLPGRFYVVIEGKEEVEVDAISK